MKLVLISDLHGRHKETKIPKCDLLISAGDYSFHGREEEVRSFHEWLDEQDADHIISLQGNHEMGVERNFQLSKDIALKECPRAHFIEEGPVVIEGKKIWCSAISPFFCNWAYNRYPGKDIQKHWDRIPEGIDVLVTHGPPFGILDTVLDFNAKICEYEDRHCGCPQLLKKVLEIKPKLHVFGHIHPGYGQLVQDGITFVNAALLNDQYKLVNNPVVIDI